MYLVAAIVLLGLAIIVTQIVAIARERRAGLVEELARAAAEPRLPKVVPDGAAPFDVVMHALHVACGAQAIGLESVRFEERSERTMEEKLYRFRVEHGVEKIEGIFVATPEEVANAIGILVEFYEPWGKHSYFEHTLCAADFTVLTNDQAFIAKAKDYGIVEHGTNPIGLVADMRTDGRLPKKSAEKAS